jgi:hypothetical protein
MPKGSYKLLPLSKKVKGESTRRYLGVGENIHITFIIVYYYGSPILLVIIVTLLLYLIYKPEFIIGIYV